MSQPVTLPGPPVQAVRNGHALEYDPPAAMSPADRWTCATCGHAAIRNGSREYGNAVDRPCFTSP